MKLLLFLILISLPGLCFAQYTPPVGGTTGPSGVTTSGLLGEYRFDEGSGSSVFDHSGNGNDGVVVGGPTWSTLGLTFNASSKRVTLPAALTASFVTIQVFCDWSPANTGTGFRAAVGNTNAVGFNLLTSTSVGGTQLAGGANPAIYWNGFATSAADSLGNLGMVTLVLDASNDVFYINGKAVKGYTSRSGSTALSRVGSLELGGSSGGGFTLNGQMYYALVYSSALTGAQVAQNYAAVSTVLAKRGVDLNPVPSGNTSQLVFDGDSITAGLSSASGANSISGQIVTSETFTKTNLGVSGQELRQMMYGSAKVVALLTPLASRNIVIVFGGTNDNIAGRTAAQTYADLSAYCLILKKAGFQVVVVTMLSRTGSDTFKNSYNALIRAGWQNFADEIADPAQNTNLGADNAYSNATYFQDSVHPTTAANLIIAGYLGNAVDRLTTPFTNTTAGTTGAQTIHKRRGSVNFAAAGTSLVVTDDAATANSIIQATVLTNDTTLKSVQAVAANGSFTLYANAAATAETRVSWTVIN